MTHSDELVSISLIAWLVARDIHLRPSRVRITEYPPLHSPEEWLGGISIRSWECGDKTSPHVGECGFSQIVGSQRFKAYYLWGPLIGGEYLLEWLPERSSFEVSLLSFT
jgi:hypothetical protein